MAISASVRVQTLSSDTVITKMRWYAARGQRVGEKSNFTHQDRFDTAVSRKGVIYRRELPRITCPALREAQLVLPHQSALCLISHAELRTCPGERKQKFEVAKLAAGSSRTHCEGATQARHAARSCGGILAIN